MKLLKTICSNLVWILLVIVSFLWAVIQRQDTKAIKGKLYRQAKAKEVVEKSYKAILEQEAHHEERVKEALKNKHNHFTNRSSFFKRK